MNCGILDGKNKNMVGDIIRRLRVEKGISQKELSDSFNVIDGTQTTMSASTLSKIERGKRCVNDIEIAAFAQALDVSVCELFGRS